jgi:hypothetical protein
MKRITIAVVSVIVVAALILGASGVMASKPQAPRDVIAKSNGFPSGAHFNLNIHGKHEGYTGDPTSGGKSVFVSEYGSSTIQYVSNKKSSVTELTVLDPLAEGFDGDPAEVQLPKEEQGFYVFARILGKSNNGLSGNESSIILYPNDVVQACNDPGNHDFGDLTECPEDPLMALGLIVGTNLYTAEPEGYVRFDPQATRGKGKSKATDITRLFTYAGWVVDETLDFGGPEGVPDGVIDEYDVPADAYSAIPETQPYDSDGNLQIDVGEWLTYQSEQDPPMAWYFAPEDQMWIFNIADLVVTEQGLVNDGTKLLQIRFYPVATTDFTQ